MEIDTHEEHKNQLTFQEKIGSKITLFVGTMWVAYAFTLLALISLPQAIRSHDTVIIVAWIAQTFIQLVLLPIIIVGQNVQSKFDEVRSDRDDKLAIEADKLDKEMLAILQLMAKNIAAIKKELEMRNAKKAN